VEGLHSGSLARFLALVRDHWPLEQEDYQQLEAAAKEAITSGPAVVLYSLKANLPRLKRKHVKCLAFFKENPGEVLESTGQVQDRCRMELGSGRV
jgi:hypothetical protein